MCAVRAVPIHSFRTINKVGLIGKIQNFRMGFGFLLTWFEIPLALEGFVNGKNLGGVVRFQHFFPNILKIS